MPIAVMASCVICKPTFQCIVTKIQKYYFVIRVGLEGFILPPHSGFLTQDGVVCNKSSVARNLLCSAVVTGVLYELSHYVFILHLIAVASCSKETVSLS